MDWEDVKMQYVGYKKIQGTISTITGLHIGGAGGTLEIGGKDNPIIEHPLTKEPYIPGSSLKGKMRSLLELNLGKHNNSSVEGWGEVHTCADPSCPVCTLFGSSADEASNGPTRLVVRDAVLNSEFIDAQKRRNPNWTPLDLTESKYENTINRITARANPRNFERVVSGTKFTFEIVYRVFRRPEEKDKEDSKLEDEKLFEHVLEAMKLIESDALGGAGSRGCGQVKFTIKDKKREERSLAEIAASDIETIPIRTTE